MRRHRSIPYTAKVEALPFLLCLEPSLSLLHGRHPGPLPGTSRWNATWPHKNCSFYPLSVVMGDGPWDAMQHLMIVFLVELLIISRLLNNTVMLLQFQIPCFTPPKTIIPSTLMVLAVFLVLSDKTEVSNKKQK